MVTQILELAVVSSVLLLLVMHGCQWRRLRSRRPEVSHDELPPVSVLKPLKGVDSDLERNLRSFFHLDYPEYELVFGVHDPDDPALNVVRAVASEHPKVPVSYVASDRRVGFNPKVNNLANLLRVARYDVLVISDSNVAVQPEYLLDLTAELMQPGVGLVTSLIRGQDAQGLGGHLERLQLNTFVMAGVAAVSTLTVRACAVGKSMMLRRDDLERIGGFEELGRYLAEDQVCGEKLVEIGARAVVSGSPIDNVLGQLGVREFAARHLRWARIRRRIDPVAYACEILANPVVPALIYLLNEPGLRSLSVLAALIAVLAGIAAATERRLGVKRPPLGYPVLELLRGLALAALWPVPFFSSTVAWRGNEFRIGRKTLLSPLAVDSMIEARR